MKKNIEIYEPTFIDKVGIGFINWAIQNSVENLPDRYRPKNDIEFKYYLNGIYANRPKIIKVDGKIVCMFWASDIEEDLTCYLHLCINTHSNSGHKNFALFKKHNIDEYILDNIFSSNKINSILLFMPEWMVEKNIIRNGQKTTIKNALHKLIDISGLKYIGLIRDAEKYHGKNKAVFQYQISRTFFYKWKSIRNSIKKGFSIGEISKNYGVKYDIIDKVSKQKGWAT